ncbi:hypothetical protein BAE44_0018518 [Dichanthelium oligosanthes]|uniref:Uncharacterized protein n=1 Tax=Dichanthelium oligosanthes TaxID=888268 RepID=A0A1E5V5M5_9POAL|nr:hypothetical protein BAE44_0018518 [Dichanthelium oligosanthes]
MAASSQWQLLKLLDLEGCKGLKKHHLKCICKILLLKYLSLRNTDVTELPNKIKSLRCLETLDIRQTKVRLLAKKAIVLPLLRHFLAGQKISESHYDNRSEELFSVVEMPLGIQRMGHLEILSHVQVSNHKNDLVGISQLLKLRKLRIALRSKNAKLTDLFQQIEKLHGCLRSLSIRIYQPADAEYHDAGTVDSVPTLPKFIETLNISGITSGLPHMIHDQHQLGKLTLTETYLNEEDLRILGNLRGLHCLRLQHKSYTESEIGFKEEEFQALKFLLVRSSDVTSISFLIGAAPRLERILWCFSTLEALSGVDHLPKLKKLELNGDCNLEQWFSIIRRRHWFRSPACRSQALLAPDHSAPAPCPIYGAQWQWRQAQREPRMRGGRGGAIRFDRRREGFWAVRVLGFYLLCGPSWNRHHNFLGGPTAEDPSVGTSWLLAHLRRLLWLLWTIPARHQIATWIRELKVRAQEVGDRHLRYGITMPDSAPSGDNVHDGHAQSPWAGAGEEEEHCCSEMAQGAVDTLLGRLTALLIDEAQLLGRLRGDVQFIRDEMESMNSLLLHLTEAQHRAHHVRTWMRQVVGLARDCEAYVELYLRRVGGPTDEDHPGAGCCSSSCLMAHLRRLLRLLRTLPARHRIANRIQELKVRARDVGDRRLRYGITVPDSAGADTYDGDSDAQSPRTAAQREVDLKRRAALFDGVEPPADDKVVENGINTLIKWLLREPAPAGDNGEPRIRVFCVTGRKLANEVAEGVYQHPSMASLFGYKKFITDLDLVYRYQYMYQFSVWTDQLKGKLSLIVVEDVSKGDVEALKALLYNLLHADVGCHPGSAIVITTPFDDLALSSSPYKIINARNVWDFYGNKARKLSPGNMETAAAKIACDLCRHSGAFVTKMFLHFLYVNPTITDPELTTYDKAISKCQLLNQSISQKMVMFCYNELPSKYRSCLLYLAIFPQGQVIKTTTLARRWIAEGLITTTTRSNETETAEDEAESYWDVLVTRGFISPEEISAEGNIKSCTLHPEVHKFIAKVSRDVNIIETNLPTDWAHYLSIHNRIRLQKPHSGGHSKDFAASLPSLAASPQWKLLKVLDLEGCQGLKKHHLKSICKILLLKYLSLRNTDVTELPEQIKELQCLETLDIRQTKVQALAKKPVVLPLLKHFLAGHKVCGSNDARTSEESMATVSVPLCIQKMKNMEILSHAQVTHRDRELVGIAQLLKLRKLGVALQGKNVKLNDLFCQIEKLHKCLRSLSIRMGQPAGSENHDAEEVDALPSLPQFIERLNISGITSGLVYSIKEHHQLAKITLSETYLKEEDLRILGKLYGLRWLRLQHKSYTESELAFQEDEFQSLNYLLVRGNDVTRISFPIGTAPKLERFVWSFDRMDALCGINHLLKLKKVELNGDCNLDPVKEALEWHPNEPILKHKPHHQRQEDGTAAAASPSSAP